MVLQSYHCWYQTERDTFFSLIFRFWLYSNASSFACGGLSPLKNKAHCLFSSSWALSNVCGLGMNIVGFMLSRYLYYILHSQNCIAYSQLCKWWSRKIEPIKDLNYRTGKPVNWIMNKKWSSSILASNLNILTIKFCLKLQCLRILGSLLYFIINHFQNYITFQFQNIHMIIKTHY